MSKEQLHSSLDLVRYSSQVPLSRAFSVSRKLVKGHKETHGSDGGIHYLHRGGGFMGVDIWRNLPSCTLSICAVYCTSVIPR